MLVNAKVVRPANVTTEFCFNLDRSMLLFDGAKISCKTMFVQAATAGAICAKVVQVHCAADVVVADVVVVVVVEDERGSEDVVEVVVVVEGVAIVEDTVVVVEVEDDTGG